MYIYIYTYLLSPERKEDLLKACQLPGLSRHCHREAGVRTMLRETFVFERVSDNHQRRVDIYKHDRNFLSGDHWGQHCLVSLVPVRASRGKQTTAD